jgi:hypothetical protein
MPTGVRGWSVGETSPFLYYIIEENAYKTVGVFGVLLTGQVNGSMLFLVRFLEKWSEPFKERVL